MIHYNPVDGDITQRSIKYRPRTCFLMTKLGEPQPKSVKKIRDALEVLLVDNGIDLIDANSELTGKDFMVKIWEMIVSVPLGIAIISDELSVATLENIFYELGMFQLLGKETLVIKTDNSTVPSDFVRTEYLEYGSTFKARINSYVSCFFEQAEHYLIMADQLLKEPLLELDYLKRSYLISGDKMTRQRIEKLLSTHAFDGYTSSVYKQILKY